MAKTTGKNESSPTTVVDDIRRIRAKLSEECGNDVAKLAALANKAGVAFRRKQQRMNGKKRALAR